MGHAGALPGAKKLIKTLYFGQFSVQIGVLGPSWGRLGPSWGFLGHSWPVLGPYRPVLGPYRTGSRSANESDQPRETMYKCLRSKELSTNHEATVGHTSPARFVSRKSATRCRGGSRSTPPCPRTRTDKLKDYPAPLTRPGGMREAIELQLQLQLHAFNPKLINSIRVNSITL